MMMKTYVARSAAAIALAVFALAGCSGEVSVGGNSVSQSELEQLISDKLEEEVGQKPDNIDCPDGLDAKVGAKQTCTLTAGEDSLSVSVVATKVNKETGTVSFDIEVEGADPTP